MRDFVRDIDAESIYRKCQVVQGPVTKVPAQFSKERKRGPDPCYLHRFDLKQMRRNKFILEPIESLESTVLNSSKFSNFFCPSTKKIKSHVPKSKLTCRE